MEPQQDFEEFVRARWSPLLRTAILLAGDPYSGEDLLQDTLARAAQRWTVIAAAGSPEAYVRRILYTRSVDTWRWRRRQADPVDVEAATAGGGPGRLGPDGRGLDHTDHTQLTDARVALASALRRLTPKQRAVLVVRFYEDRTEVEAARILGCSVNTVKSQTRHALGRLRELAPELAETFGRQEVSS
ncbi:SigE family RNA polymerase sigma factor [Pedococcus aerophilus]|uniref:SigE family RNA polymerase sigma factor n=1 Tax=Pedococcus aerophilus TaxID=436356 RepID=A0ABN3UL55_9MICO